MRCPNCNKFVSYDEPETEAQAVGLDDVNVRATVSVKLNCQDCGETLKDADIEAEAEIKHACKPLPERDKEWKPDPDWKGGDNQFELEDDGQPEGTSRLQEKDRNGKPIKLSRYKKSFYGFTMEPEIRCRKCGEVFTVTVEGEEQASAFNENC